MTMTNSIHGVRHSTVAATVPTGRNTRGPHRLCFFSAIGLMLMAFVASSSQPVRATVQTLSVQRADDSYITAYVERDHLPEKQSVLLLLQGSICESVAPGAGDRMAFDEPAGMARLDIEKYAISASQHGSEEHACPDDYLRHNSIDQRVIDVLTVVASLRGNAAWWDGRIYLMGTSEGATVAAMVGPLLAETRGIVLVNGSIGRPFREGWSDAMATSVAAAGGDAAAQAAVRDEATATWIKARRNPSADEQAFGNGNTLKWWSSIIDLRPSNLLALVDTPILLLQADHDEMTPASSARAVAARFRAAGKTNLDYVELKGLSHGLRTLDGKPGWQPVLARINLWLARKHGEARRPLCSGLDKSQCGQLQQ